MDQFNKNQDEPVAWVIDYVCEGQGRRGIFGNNAIGDYRDIDPHAISTPLYLISQSDDKLRKAAKEVLAILKEEEEECKGWVRDQNLSIQNILNDALEDK